VNTKYVYGNLLEGLKPSEEAGCYASQKDSTASEIQIGHIVVPDNLDERRPLAVVFAPAVVGHASGTAIFNAAGSFGNLSLEVPWGAAAKAEAMRKQFKWPLPPSAQAGTDTP
jgi:hypothetical protein